MKLLTLAVFVFIIGCGLNERKTKQKDIDVISVNSNKQYAELVFKDTLYINGTNPLIGQISNVISKVGHNGHIILYDKKNRLFIEYDEIGNFIGIIGKKGEGPGEYIKPSNIFIDKYLFF